MSTAKTSSVNFTIGRIASLACLLEVSASKPGNVHRGADFEDLSFNDFLVSAEILGQVIDSRTSSSTGQLILETVRATDSIVGTNTNLGIALLICPLAIAADSGPLSQSIMRRHLKQLTPEDARLVYDAIRIAGPGGLGTVDEMDVSADAPSDILAAMRYSSDQDLIARQYTNGFEQIFDEVVPLLTSGQIQFGNVCDGIIYAHVSMLARYGDSLIQRKSGIEASNTARTLARNSLSRLMEDSRDGWFEALGDLDFWMRSDGHRRNPGTTADLIAAGMFVGIVNEEIAAPFV